MRNKSWIILGMFLATGAFGLSGNAAEIDTIFIRAKAGPAYYSKLDPVSSAFALGLDVGYRWSSGLGLMGKAIRGFDATGSNYESTQGASPSVSTSSYFFGLGPTYSVSKGIVALSFGLNLGAMSTSSTSASFNPYSTYSSSSSRFAVAPDFTLDFAITPLLSANLGMTYITAFGSSPKPSVFLPMAGVGINF